MAEREESAGRPREGLLQRVGLGSREARAWACYDWANSAMVTVIITAVFPIYYKSVAAADLSESVADVRFARATTVALATVAVLAPILGALADFRAWRKLLLAAFTALGVVATAGLFFVEKGDWGLALVLFALGNIGAAGGAVFYDSLLPHVAPPGGADRLSTAGYALGYVGGGIALAVCILAIQVPAIFGLPSGEGLTDSQASLPTRLSFAFVAVWWALFTLPILLRVPEPRHVVESDETAVGAGSRVTTAAALRVSFQRLGETFRALRRYRHAFWMLLAFLLYNDGIQTIIRMAALYAESKHLDRGLVITTILVIQFIGVPFSFLFGGLAGRFGTKTMIYIGLAVYAVITLLAYGMTANWHFVALGALVGMVQGGTQGLSRSLFSTMIPQHKSGEFFALFAVGEKFAGILGPLLFGEVIAWTGSPQKAILSVIVFFVVGSVLLRRVDVAEGQRAARAADEGLVPAEG